MSGMRTGMRAGTGRCASGMGWTVRLLTAAKPEHRAIKMTARARKAVRVLVVTYDARLAARLERALMAAGYATRWEWSSLTALAVVAEWAPALVVLDWTQPFLDGPTLTAALRVGVTSPPPVIAFLRGTSVGWAQLGVAAVLPKTPSPGQLVAVVGRVLAPPEEG
jgi:DNA-binding response OmpR family regulator